MEKTDTRAKVYDILKSFRTAMFVTTALSGRPAARPMQVAHIDDDSGDVWFFTGKGGSLVEEIEKESIVLLVFQTDTSAYLSSRGNARIVQDPGRIHEYWKEPYKVWFPGGPTDPELALVGVRLIDAEYWDTRGTNKLEYLFEAAKAYIKGEKPQVDEPDHHGKTKL